MPLEPHLTGDCGAVGQWKMVAAAYVSLLGSRFPSATRWQAGRTVALSQHLLFAATCGLIDVVIFVPKNTLVNFGYTKTNDNSD